MLTLTPAADQGANDGKDPRLLLLDGHPLGSRPGGLATDIDQVGAVGGQRPAAADGVLEGEEPAAVGEGVGGDVDDAHDQRAVELAQVVGQPGGFTGRGHGSEPTDGEGSAGLNARP